MRLEDALFNWLQIKLVAEARPDDGAAADTLSFFAEILAEDHKLTDVECNLAENGMISVRYVKEGREERLLIPHLSAESLLRDIEMNPKYN